MITPEMTIGDVLRRYPQTAKVFRKFGLECMDCQIANLEEIGHGAGVHKVDLDELLKELNDLVKD
ncbi:MAG: DUF1858 domain-containing protein [Desulfuromonadales bacterium]|nr:DUF1858 domain-containing protein [Desulfuromonadales bacterium]NIR33964.1 DUF1858 domain-containing protein [Desulfuromonadales bacterium]NIS41512.1 DUF1858 domain-containing protein [Desulfuromonadales bacterium]